MTNLLNIHDVDVILTALEHTRHKYENYAYPTYELKQQRLKEVNDVMFKLQELKKTLNA